MSDFQLKNCICRKTKLTDRAAGDLLESTLNVVLGELVKGHDVKIPGLGVLQVKTLPDRRTVFFKQENSSDKSLVENIDPVVFECTNELLRAGEEVDLPGLGIFRSKSQTESDWRFSFIPAISLRNLLNGGMNRELPIVTIAKEEFLARNLSQDTETQKKIVEEEVLQQGLKLDQAQGEANVRREERKEEKQKEEVKVVKIVPNKATSSTSMPPKTGEKIREKRVSPYQEQSKLKTNKPISTILIVLFCCLLLLTCFFVLCRKQKDKQEIKEVQSVPTTEFVGSSISSQASTNLLDLAKKNYGNNAFWVYIYQANAGKLSSPISIPIGTELSIPDLKLEYNIDCTDSLEIKRANILAEKILRETKIK